MALKTINTNGWRTRGGLLVAVGAAQASGSLTASAAEAPPLGAARSFAVLGGSTVSNTGGSIINGDVGVSPGSEIVGFPPGSATGGIYVGGTTEADQAHADAAIAYAFLAGMASNTNLTSTDLGGLTLAPGVYTYNSSAQLTGALTLDAGGDSAAVFVFQIATALTTSSGSTVTVINCGPNYDESNVFWQCGSSATLGLGTAFIGNIIADQSITLETGSSIIGNVLAINGAATLDGNSVSSPTVVAPPPAAVLSPINLTAVMIAASACTAADLAWTDASDNETEFRVFRRDGSGPAFLLIATIPSTNMAGMGGAVTHQDMALIPTTTYTYRVTAFSPVDGESLPSNEALVESCGVVAPPTRWLDVHLGRLRSTIRDGNKSRTDRVNIRGSYSMINVVDGEPTVVHNMNPTAYAMVIRIEAPGSFLLLNIPANDAGWKTSNKGRVFTWRSNGDTNAPVGFIRLDTRKSEFTFRSRRNEFGSVPVNDIKFSLTCDGVTGSDTRTWNLSTTSSLLTRALFTLPR